MPVDTHAGAVLLRPLVDRIAAATMGLVEARDGGVWLDDRAARDIASAMAEITDITGGEGRSIADVVAELEGEVEQLRSEGVQLEIKASNLQSKLDAIRKAAAA